MMNGWNKYKYKFKYKYKYKQKYKLQQDWRRQTSQQEFLWQQEPFAQLDPPEDELNYEKPGTILNSKFRRNCIWLFEENGPQIEGNSKTLGYYLHFPNHQQDNPVPFD